MPRFLRKAERLSRDEVYTSNIFGEYLARPHFFRCVAATLLVQLRNDGVEVQQARTAQLVERAIDRRASDEVNQRRTRFETT